MRNLLVVALLLPALGACEKIPGTINHAVARRLIDPSSARIEFTHKEADFACGLVNGKNRMGGYAGATPFIWSKFTGDAEIYDEPKMLDFEMMRHGGSESDHQEAALKITDGCGFVDKWETQCGGTIPHDKELCRLWKSGDMQELSRLADQY